jgi:hypothetical protein
MVGSRDPVQPDTTPPAASPMAGVPPEAMRDDWLRPLIDQLTAKAEQIGRLKAERDDAMKYADDLRNELAALRAAQDRRRAPERDPEVPTGTAAQQPARRPWRVVARSWWRWIGRG